MRAMSLEMPSNQAAMNVKWDDSTSDAARTVEKQTSRQ